MNPITFNYTGAIQSYPVPVGGTYTLSVLGAGGGSNNVSAGGLGARVSADFLFSAGNRLLILTGQAGGAGTFTGGGGGGGSFVYLDVDNSGTLTNNDRLLLAAGGGGGGGAGSPNPAGGDGLPANAAGGSGSGAGGVGGQGLGGANGGGGAGINGAGGNGDRDVSGGGAPSIQGRGTAGGSGGAGGYGGGGGGGFSGGGGGGGYTGGDGGASVGSRTNPSSGGRSYINTLVAVSSSSAGGINAGDGLVEVTCYVTGTRIRVLRDGTETDVPVEALSVGDRAVTASGEHRPIRWIGSRSLDPRRHPRPHEAQPVRIRAHAFGENRPARDLRVSPGHSVAVNVLGEVLIPASALVDGSTIVQEDVARVTYWHVELDSHDLLIAENLPAESYLDMGNRAFFGDDGVVTLHAGPDADPSARTHADFCRPFHDAGLLVELVRARLAERAAEGRRTTGACASSALRRAG